jgi:hypothetical protein
MKVPLWLRKTFDFGYSVEHLIHKFSLVHLLQRESEEFISRTARQVLFEDQENYARWFRSHGSALVDLERKKLSEQATEWRRVTCRTIELQQALSALLLKIEDERLQGFDMVGYCEELFGDEWVDSRKNFSDLTIFLESAFEANWRAENYIAVTLFGDDLGWVSMYQVYSFKLACRKIDYDFSVRLKLAEEEGISLFLHSFEHAGRQLAGLKDDILRREKIGILDQDEMKKAMTTELEMGFIGNC